MKGRGIVSAMSVLVYVTSSSSCSGETHVALHPTFACTQLPCCVAGAIVEDSDGEYVEVESYTCLARTTITRSFMRRCAWTSRGRQYKVHNTYTMIELRIQHNSQGCSAYCLVLFAVSEFFISKPVGVNHPADDP